MNHRAAIGISKGQLALYSLGDCQNLVVFPRRSIVKTVFLHHSDKLDGKSSSEQVHVVIGNTILQVC